MRFPTPLTITVPVILLLAILLAPAAFAQSPAVPPAPAPTATAPAPAAAPDKPTVPASGPNDRIIVRDASGKRIATERNPEADKPAFASQQPASAKPASGNSPVFMLLKGVLMLGWVLVIAYVAVLLLKKYYYGPRPSGAAASTTDGTPGSAIRVLESSTLGQGRALYLVAVGSRCFLVGATLQQLSVLGDVTEDARVQALLASAPARPAGLPFQQVLSHLLPHQDADGGKGGRA